MRVHGNEWLSRTPIAHRGLHDDKYPENSMPAFLAAADAGYGVELDLHISSDDRLVVFHDDDLKRLTGRDGLVTSLDAAQLSELHLNETEYTIPLFEGVLQAIDGRVPILAEVKSGSPMARVGPILDKLVNDYEGPLAIQSFDPRVLIWLKQNAPHVTRGQISGSFKGERLPRAQKLLLQSMLLNAFTRPDFLAFDVRAMPSAPVFIWRKTLKAPLLLWTVRSTEELTRAHDHDANVIFESIDPAV
ncbi:MAG TPA: glycerophosphodiester phosphodiesterase family protein [Propionibacteriaceae bacterium]|nr:glycerophosphodiester phosphodiesterase family protein [Propionibacteriaceae bacterium]